MRIKQYDYDTCFKLKNPLRDFNEVYKWIDSEFNYIGMNNFLEKIYDFDDFGDIRAYVGSDYLYFSEDWFNSFYSLDKVKSYIKDKDLFEDLKQKFIQYKLKEKLEKELKVNQITTKRIKI